LPIAPDTAWLADGASGMPTPTPEPSPLSEPSDTECAEPAGRTASGRPAAISRGRATISRMAFQKKTRARPHERGCQPDAVNVRAPQRKMQQNPS